MVWYEKKWWTKLWKEKANVKVDVQNDIKAIQEFLRDVQSDISALQKVLPEYAELEKEGEVAKKHLQKPNLEAQATQLDTLLTQYEFLQTDVDINGLRLKNIAREFLKKAEKAGLKELVKKKQKDQRWTFGW